MKLVTITGGTTDPEIQRVIDINEFGTLSGVDLAALLFPHPTVTNVDTVNDFLDHYRR